MGETQLPESFAPSVGMSIALAIFGLVALLSAAFIHVRRASKAAPVIIRTREPIGRPQRRPERERVYPTPTDPLFAFRGREIRPLERQAA